MKKRIIAILLLAAMAVSVLAGCDVITKNEQRDLEQPIVTVKYEGLTSYVTKGDIITAFNSYGYYYVYYYGYTTEETFELLAKSLAERELIILYARKYHAEAKGVAADGPIENMLTLNEVKYAIEQVNQSMETAVKSSLDELQAEIDAAKEKEEDSAQAIKLTTSDEITYQKGDTFDPADYYIEITDDDGEVTTVELTDDMYDESNFPDMSSEGVKTFTVTYDGSQYSVEIEVNGLAARTARPAESEADFDPEAVYEGALPVKFGAEGYVYEHEYNESGVKNTLFASALKELKDTMAANYKTYNDYLNEQLEGLLLSSLQRKIAAGELTADKISARLAANAVVLVNQNIESFAKTETAYSSALTGGISKIGYYPEDGYGFVYNILLKFSDEQAAELAKYNGSSTTQGIYYSTDEAYYAVREILAGQITVNISNLYYDAEYECDEHTCGFDGCTGGCDEHSCGNPECPANAYVAYAVPAEDVLSWIKADLDAARAIENKYERVMAINEVTLQWLFRVNDDSGMYGDSTINGIANNGLGYLVTPEGKTSTYVDEFTDQARALISQGLGSYATDYDDIKTMYCITDYGIHIIVVSYIPYDFAAVGIDGNAVFANAEQFDTRKLPMDYIIEYGRVQGAEGHFTLEEGSLSYSFDVSDMYTDGVFNVSKSDKTKTMGDTLTSTLKTNVTSDIYNYNVKQLIYDKWDDNVKTNEKKLKKLYED